MLLDPFFPIDDQLSEFVLKIFAEICLLLLMPLMQFVDSPFLVVFSEFVGEYPAFLRVDVAAPGLVISHLSKGLVQVSLYFSGSAAVVEGNHGSRV